jgi:hypothetical protein
MKKIVVLCLALGMGFSFAMCGQSAHTQSITPQRGLVGATTGGGLVVSGNKLGLFPCAAGQAPVSNGTSWACGDTTPPDNSVTLAKLADIATARILGRTTAGTGDPEALTGAQATALLDTVTTSNKGLVPTAPNDTTKFLRGDGTWAVLQGWSSMFGSGVDGDVTFDGAATVLGFAPSSNTYTVTRDISVDHMVISSGVTVFAHGVRVFSKSGISGTGTLSVRGNDGGNATGSTVSGAAGAAIADRTFKGVSAGVVGGSATPSANSYEQHRSVSLTLPAEAAAGEQRQQTVSSARVASGGSGGGATGGAAGVTMVSPGTITLHDHGERRTACSMRRQLSPRRALATVRSTRGALLATSGRVRQRIAARERRRLWYRRRCDLHRSAHDHWHHDRCARRQWRQRRQRDWRLWRWWRRRSGRRLGRHRVARPRLRHVADDRYQRWHRRSGCGWRSWAGRG